MNRDSYTKRERFISWLITMSIWWTLVFVWKRYKLIINKVEVDYKIDKNPVRVIIDDSE